MTAPREAIELLVERRGDTIALLSPEVGLFTGARAAGDLLAPGVEAGVLLALGRALALRVPSQIEGRVITAPPARARQAVGWGDLLYEIEPPSVGADPPAPRRSVDAAAEGAPGAAGGVPGATGDAAAARLVRSTQSGRFYLRPAPDQPPFAAEGAIVEKGQPLGLIEVMKTFAHVRYDGPDLPERARIARVLVEDGAEVAIGDALFEVEAGGDG